MPQSSHIPLDIETQVLEDQHSTQPITELIQGTKYFNRESQYCRC
jgi:hypothetical protein